MADEYQPELRVKIRFHEGAGDEAAAPVALVVHPDGVVEVAGRERLEPGGRVKGEAWTVAVEKSDRPWAGPELLILPPDGAGRMRCPLPEAVGTTVLLGRSRRACDITIYDDHVSRVHLKVTRTDNGYSVEDMQSKWGTMFNGRPMQSKTLLGHGDELRIGSTAVRFLTRWDEAASRPPRPLDGTDLDLFETAETSPGVLGDTPVPGFGGRPTPPMGLRVGSGGARPPSSSTNPGLRPRPTVPPLYIGIGLGLMIAVVGIVIWTLISLLWPGA